MIYLYKNKLVYIINVLSLKKKGFFLFLDIKYSRPETILKVYKTG